MYFRARAAQIPTPRKLVSATCAVSVCSNGLSAQALPAMVAAALGCDVLATDTEVRLSSTRILGQNHAGRT